MIHRLAWYLASIVVLCVVLWILVVYRLTGVFQVVVLAADLLGVAVTWSVARREGLSPIAWSALAFAIGPLAWVAMASRARPEGGTGGVVLGGLAIGMGVLIDAIVFGFVRIVPA